MAKNTTPRAPRASRKGAAVAAIEIQLNMTTGADLVEGDPELASLSALIDSIVVSDEVKVGAADDEVIIEPDEEVAAAVAAEVTPAAPSAEDAMLDEMIAQLSAPDVSDADIEAAVEAAEATEASMRAAVPDAADPGAEPTEGEIATAPTTGKPAKKVKSVGTGAPRVYWGKNKVGRIQARLGESAGEYTVLTLADAGLDEAALKLKVQETYDIIAKMNSKKANRAAMFIEFVAGKKASLNNVISRTLSVLAADGFISTGMQGNSMVNLLAVPYTVAAARAMGGNTISMLEDLAVLAPDGKGRFVGNPESLLLMKANSMLGLTFKTPAAAS